MKLWEGKPDGVLMSPEGLKVPKGVIKKAYCMLGYDIKNREIGIFPTDENARNSYKVQTNASKETDLITCRAFLKFLRLSTSVKNVRYSVKENGEIIVYYGKPYTSRKSKKHKKRNKEELHD